MSGSPTSTQDSKGRRNQVMCAECRKAKKKCVPQPRDFQLTGTKCDPCLTRGCECGPNFRYDEDTAFQERKGKRPLSHASENSRETTGGQALEASARVSAYAVLSQASHRNRVGEGATLRRPRSIDYADTLGNGDGESVGDDIYSMVETFDSYIHILDANSHPALTCPNALPSFPLKKDIETKLRRLSIRMFEIGFEAYERNERLRARWLFSELIGCLDQYPHLYDVRDGDFLRRMATILKEVGPARNFRHIVLKIKDHADGFSPSDRLNHMLTESFEKTSDITNALLARLWRDQGDSSEVPAFLVVPPAQLAVLHIHPDAVLAVLSHYASKYLRRTISSPKYNDKNQMITDLFDPQTPLDIPRLKAISDVRDFCGRTPLFLAAKNRRLQCCYALLQAHADPNNRDFAGHSVLEAACRAGHEEIVEFLIRAGCNVNPVNAGCASSPLQAAVDNDKPKKVIVQLLLERGADIYDKRSSDGKSALDIVRERNLFEFEQKMREQSHEHSQGPFRQIGNNADQAHR